MPPLFDPAGGATVIEAIGNDSSFWAGACSALHDDETGKFYLYY